MYDRTNQENTYCDPHDIGLAVYVVVPWSYDLTKLLVQTIT